MLIDVGSQNCRMFSFDLLCELLEVSCSKASVIFNKPHFNQFSFNVFLLVTLFFTKIACVCSDYSTLYGVGPFKKISKLLVIIIWVVVNCREKTGKNEYYLGSKLLKNCSQKCILQWKIMKMFFSKLAAEQINWVVSIW